MRALKRHPLVKADLQHAYNWYEDECPGLGEQFRAEFLQAYRKLIKSPLLYAVRFVEIRRMNLDRFPYGIFYRVDQDEICILAILHGSREDRTVLAERRRTFQNE
ncbi:MAG TPA: type II toxin-antitoxin system RelE/ParE family toxin [Verrucomicrobiae bacterium]|jgi:plasmid stabilization system protein ParE|nr:type II toxin-antitoxin system RelE/ParE family toxin [Verrucomicrobiae bacterium]